MSGAGLAGGNRAAVPLWPPMVSVSRRPVPGLRECGRGDGRAAGGGGRGAAQHASGRLFLRKPMFSFDTRLTEAAATGEGRVPQRDSALTGRSGVRHFSKKALENNEQSSV
jgi:hypothetical protein